MRGLDQVSCLAPISLPHELGHEETMFVEFLFSGLPVTIAVAVTRLGIPFLEDCYPTSETIEEIRRRAADDPQMPFQHIELSPADARARIQDYVDHGDHMNPPTETGTWPTARLLLSWLLRFLPNGGEVEQPHEWKESELEPPRRGATVVHLIMGDLYPRKILADENYMLSMPTVLGALVQFANDRSGTSAQFTTAALEAIDEDLPQHRHREAEGSNTSGGPAQGLADTLRLPPGVELPEGLVEELTALGVGADAPSQCSRMSPIHCRNRISTSATRNC